MNKEKAQGGRETLQKSHRETPRCRGMNNSTGTTYSPHWITQDTQKQRIYVGKQPLNTSYRQGLVTEVQKAPLQTPNPHPTMALTSPPPCSLCVLQPYNSSLYQMNKTRRLFR